jgi:hypothetical protein
MRAERGSVGIGVGIDILNVQKIRGTMSDFFNEYKRTEKCEYSISKQENLIYEQIKKARIILKCVYKVCVLSLSPMFALIMRDR